jgi:NDP-sugar pyrophosphorylase family protein
MNLICANPKKTTTQGVFGGMLKPTDFFDLDEFEHKQLFEPGETNFVWDALKTLRQYLDAIIVPDIQGQVMPGAHIVGDHIFIGPGSVVEPGAMIIGPVYIGKNSRIRHGAYVREYVLVGDNCVVGHTTEIKDSIMLNDAKAAHFAYVGNSILGNHVNLGAGTKLANLKLDRSNIIISVDGKYHDTEVHKFGAVLGDRSQTGCNTVTNPGTLMAPGCLAYALSSPYGYYPPGTLIKAATRKQTGKRR